MNNNRILARILNKNDFPSFVAGLKKRMTVYGPVARGKSFIFDKIEEFSQLRLDYTSTIIPPKKYFLPSKDALVRFNRKEMHGEMPEIEDKDFTILGVHPCDMQGILRLDFCFERGYYDKIYFSRRKKAILIGASCNPDEFCFCDSVGDHDFKKGYDIFITDIGQSYYITVLTERGEKILDGVNTKDVTEVDIQEAKRTMGRCSNLPGEKIRTDIANIPLLCKGGEDLMLWEDTAKKCLACGTCNLVCPTCYCFDVRDDTEMNLEEGNRYRFWDGCQIEGFAEVSGGESFRKEKKNRQKHRFYKKFRYWVPEYGTPFCVGCGRCRRQCVAKISIVEMANEMARQLQNH